MQSNIAYILSAYTHLYTVHGPLLCGLPLEMVILAGNPPPPSVGMLYTLGMYKNLEPTPLCT